MKQKTLCVLCAVLCLSIAGCGGAGVYELSAWTPPSEEADWDVASAACDARAGNRELTEAEEAEAEGEAIEEIAGVVNIHNEISDISGGVGVPGMGLLGSGFSLAGGLLGGSAGGRKTVAVKEKEFSECMTERGWRQTKK